jgi:hypothetical protein
MKWTRPILQFTLLATLLYLGYSSWQTIQARRRFAAWAESNVETEHVFAALARPVKLSSGTQSLTAFAKQLAAKSLIDVVIDDDALRMAYQPAADGINVEVFGHNLPAGSHISLTLDAIGLKWIIRRGQIVITTLEVAENTPLTVASYPLPQAALNEPSGNANDWASIIESVIAPHTWDPVSGPGHCEAVPGALVVAHRPDVHRQIRALFRALKSPDDPPRSWQPLVIWPENHDSTAALFARLERPASIDCEDLPLDELVEFLATEHDIPIILNFKKLAEASVSPTSPITKRLSGMSLGSLLIHVANEFELTVLIRDGAIQFTTPEDAENQLTLVAYPVHDLAEPQPYRGFGPPLRDYDSLIELIATTIRPDSWDDVGGPAPIDHIGGYLLIAQTPVVHAEIESLLSQLRRHLDLGAAPRVFASPARESAVSAIEAALDQPLDASFVGLPVHEFCDRLSEKISRPVLLAQRRFDEAGINSETLIPFDFPPTNARTQLNRILDSLDLDYTIRDEALIITTPEDAESNRITRVYDVRSLHETGVSLFNTHDDGTLIELIERHVAPDSWDDRGGPGAIDRFAALLVISHTPEVHQSFQRFHAELLRVAKSRSSSDRMPTALLSPALQQISAALDHTISFHCDRRPLREACHLLSLELGTTIYPHEKLLRESFASDPFAPSQKLLSAPRLFTIDFPSASGHVQLQRFGAYIQSESNSEDLGTVRNDITVIADAESIRRSSITWLYDVRALVDHQHGLFTDPDPWQGSGPNFQSTAENNLIDTITAHILPDSWHNVGGDGRIDCHQGFLIVSHSLLAHILIEEFINGLHVRQSLDHSRTISLPGHRVNDLSTVIYDISALKVTIPDFFVGMQEIPQGMSYAHHPFENYDQFLDLFTLLSPDTWNNYGGDGAMCAARDSFIVTQTLPIQREVAALLSAIEKHCSPETTETTPSRTSFWTMPELSYSDARSDSTLHTRLVFVADLLNGPSTKDSLIHLIDSLCDEANQNSWREHGGKCEIDFIPTGWLVINADYSTHAAVDAWLETHRF